MDSTINWYSAKVIDEATVQFRVPAWPFPMWPWNHNNTSLALGGPLYTMLQGQLPPCVQKSFNHHHSPWGTKQDGEDDVAQTAEILSRMWIYYTIDFSSVKDSGSLRASILNEDPKTGDALDWDLVEVDLGRGDIELEETFMGFHVGREMEDGPLKNKRGAAKMSKLGEKIAQREARKQKKAAEALAAAQAGKPDNPGSNDFMDYK